MIIVVQWSVTFNGSGSEADCCFGVYRKTTCI